MDKEKYLNYCRKWETWIHDEQEYFEKKKKLNARDASESEYRKLEKFYGHDGFNSRQFGPWTVIDDKEDLLNPEFILPGWGKSFSECTNTDHNIPQYFGLMIIDEHTGKSGIVCGYGYDSGDDYIIAEDERGERFTVIVNSHYKIFDGDKQIH